MTVILRATKKIIKIVAIVILIVIEIVGMIIAGTGAFIAICSQVGRDAIGEKREGGMLGK